MFFVIFLFCFLFAAIIFYYNFELKFKDQVWITYPHHTISEYPTISGMTQLAPIIPFRMEEPLPPPPYLVEPVMTENENPYENVV